MSLSQLLNPKNNMIKITFNYYIGILESHLNALQILPVIKKILHLCIIKLTIMRFNCIDQISKL